MLAAWALAAASPSVQLVQRRPGVLDATHATQDARARATARAARGKKAAERRRARGVVARTFVKVERKHMPTRRKCWISGRHVVLLSSCADTLYTL